MKNNKDEITLNKRDSKFIQTMLLISNIALVSGAIGQMITFPLIGQLIMALAVVGVVHGTITMYKLLNYGSKDDSNKGT